MVWKQSDFNQTNFQSWLCVKRLGCVKATLNLIYWAISWSVIDNLIAVRKKQHVVGEKKH